MVSLKYTFGLSLVLGTELQIPCYFLSDTSVFVMLRRWIPVRRLNSLRMGTGHQKNQPEGQKTGTVSLHPDPHPLWRWGRWEIVFSQWFSREWFNQACLRDGALITLNNKALELPSWLVNTWMDILGEGESRPHSDSGSSVLPSPPDLVLCVSYIWLFLSCIPCNKTINISLSWFLWVILASYQTWGRGMSWEVPNL